jgi:trehalose/maltose hydrolase-like predicted phosphorylase
MMTVFGFAGLSLRSDGVALAPHLPRNWSSLDFSMEWRGRQLTINISQADHRLHATLQAGEPMILTLHGRAHKLSLDQALVADLGGPAPK